MSDKKPYWEMSNLDKIKDLKRVIKVWRENRHHAISIRFWDSHIISAERELMKLEKAQVILEQEKDSD